jgi:hypothetical protein
MAAMSGAVATGKGKKRGGGATALLLSGTVSALALPSAVLAVSSGLEQQKVFELPQSAESSFIPASVDPRLARSITVRTLSKGQLFRFTPAATPSQSDRSVTVAVRVDARNASAFGQRPQLVANDASGGPSLLRLAPNGYSLGVSRGYKSFAQNLGISGEKIDIPDLASYRPGTSAKGDPARFSPRIALDEKQKPGSAPRTFEGQAEQTVDVGGSYRLTRNLNVTAGVRYSSERDRLVPLTDGRQDSQAVYVGTQFRF